MRVQRTPGRSGRGSLDRLVDEHASRLVRAPISALPRRIADALEAVGRRLGADRASLWELRPTDPRLVALHRWSAGVGDDAGVEALREAELPWLLEQVQAGRRVAFRSIAELPRAAFRERRFLARHGPDSGVAQPLLVGDSAIAVLVVGSVGKERAWGTSTLAVVERMGVVIASALARKRSHEDALGQVSEDRRAREEAVRLRDEIALRGQTAMLAEMGSGIAHELNQPLTAILSNAEAAQRLLRAGGATAEIDEALQDVVNDTRRAAQILRRMREMLQHRPVDRTPVDVAALLERVVHRYRQEASARRIRLSLEVPSGLPAVLGDEVQLEQVATNLLQNALEAVSEGEGPRSIGVRARPGRPDGVDVSVRDSGPGLDPDALTHAFDAFYTTKPRGLGIGLPISRSIVEAHGGRLLARNGDGGGATLELHLPAASLAAPGARWRKPV
jgi:C4-dicarboxylate-specific signal transduction histidine kinase